MFSIELSSANNMQGLAATLERFCDDGIKSSRYVFKGRNELCTWPVYWLLGGFCITEYPHAFTHRTPPTHAHAHVYMGKDGNAYVLELLLI